MQGNPDGAEILQRLAGSRTPHWQYYANADASLLTDIDTGLLFLMAFWSGPAKQSFSRLTAALEAFTEDQVSLTVIDVDGAGDLGQVAGLQQIACLYGTGELVLVRQARVVEVLRGGNLSQAEYESHIRSFLSST